MSTKSNGICTIFLCLIILAGCSTGNKEYGESISNRETTKISDVLTDSKGFIGKMVTVEGKIINECPTGCWFDLKGKTGTIFVTLPAFAIPQEVGKTVVVEGTVADQSGRIAIVGKGVMIK